VPSAPGTLTMQTNAFVNAPFEGAFAYPTPYYYEPPGGAPYPSIMGDEGQLQAGTMPGQSGIAAGRFGWANLLTGIVLNMPSDGPDGLGIVIPRRVNWEAAYWSQGSRWLRAGYGVTVIARGAFWLKFPGGAFRGDPVYANTTDGTAISGASDAGVITKFIVTFGCDPGGLAQVSTFTGFSS
jgi:hypothetical protein